MVAKGARSSGERVVHSDSSNDLLHYFLIDTQRIRNEVAGGSGARTTLETDYRAVYIYIYLQKRQ